MAQNMIPGLADAGLRQTEATAELPGDIGAQRAGEEARGKSRALLQHALEVGISLVCLFLALRTVHPRDLWQALRQANVVGLAAFVMLMLIVLALKAWRWQLLFYPEYRVPFGPIASILCVSYMVSNVLPGRVGELARVVLLPAEQPVSTGAHGQFHHR